jgi:type IV pilus assembly protein PilO
MNRFVDNVSEWPIQYKLAAWFGSLLFFSYIFWQYLYKSPAEELRRLNDKVESMEIQMTRERMLVRNLPLVRSEVQSLDRQLLQALRELPNKQETSRLLDSISDLARDAGLTIEVFKELGTSTKEFYGQKSVSLMVGGSFHQVATFFDEVGGLSRIVNINEVQMKNPIMGAEGMNLATSCTATTFWYLSEEERAEQKQAEEKAKKRSRKR